MVFHPHQKIHNHRCLGLRGESESSLSKPPPERVSEKRPWEIKMRRNVSSLPKAACIRARYATATTTIQFNWLYFPALPTMPRMTRRSSTRGRASTASRSSTLDIKYRNYSIVRPNASVAGHRIIQYRSYQRDIYIYHVRVHLLPLSAICRELQGQKEYSGKLTGFDPLRYLTVQEGDETPPGWIEAALMPSVLHGRGSALALRSDQEAWKMEWLVFSGPIHDNVLSQITYAEGRLSLETGLDANDPRKVFDLVGYAEKGLITRTVKGANVEHKGWHDSLSMANKSRTSLTLTWRGFGNELREDQERRRREETHEV